MARVDLKERKLGKSGPTVSEQGLGCMGLSVAYADAVNEHEAIRLIEHAIEQGVTFFDTAQLYADNEELLGRALKGRTKDLVIATKFGFRFDHAGNPCGFDSSPASIRSVCENSLRNLAVDTIDLFYQHRVDPNVPMADVAGTVGDLIREGKVCHFGMSEAGCEHIAAAHEVQPVAALQSEYSLWSREVENDVLPLCRRLGIGFVAYGPLGRGFLAGAARNLAENDRRRTLPRWRDEALVKNLDLVATLDAIATEKGITSAQLALAWILAQGDDIVPIPGTTKIHRLDENLAASNVSLGAAELRALDEAFPAGAAEGDRTGAFVKQLDK